MTKLFTILTLVFANLGQALATDKLVIISPHRKSIQDEFIPAFKKHYEDTYKAKIDVDWIDQGGTSDDIRFVRAKFKSNPKTSGIDIFWGGGGATFTDLNSDKLLASYKLPKDLDKELPVEASGVVIRGPNNSWYPSALSSFGIFYNKKVLTFDKLPTPSTWADLASPKFQNMLSLTDPRRSGTATFMNQLVVEALGWEKGWALLLESAGNTRAFTHSSSDPIKAVTSGDAAAAMAIDFYAYAKISDLGEANLGFILPEGQTVIDPDPIAILKGAPNRTPAERFVNFVLSKDAQKLLMLKVGAPGGPRLSYLGRMAVNSETYKETEGQPGVTTNPFKQKGYLKMDLTKLGKYSSIFNDLFGAIVVDNHTDLKAAWTALNKKPENKSLLSEFNKLPLSQVEFEKLADEWKNEVTRNKKINEWVAFAKEKFKKVREAATKK